MMDEQLQTIDLELSRLERVVLDKYEQLEASAGPSAIHVIIPWEQAHEHLAELEVLSDRLHGGGSGGMLQLVTDEHDQLRVRIIVLRNLLERDIPVPYLSRVFNELRKESVATATAPSSLSTAAASNPFLGEQQPKEAPAEALPLEVMQTMGLHYLMEEDQQQLVKPEQAMPRVTHGSQLPMTLSRFVARDLAEAHFATRPLKPKIARTPEELRQKLAARAKAQQGKDSSW